MKMNYIMNSIQIQTPNVSDKFKQHKSDTSIKSAKQNHGDSVQTSFRHHSDMVQTSLRQHPNIIQISLKHQSYIIQALVGQHKRDNSIKRPHKILET